MLAELRRNARLGQGPKTLKEKRELEAARKAEEARRQALEAAANITFGEVWERYAAQELPRKSARASRTEEGLYRLWLAPILAGRPMKDVCPFDLERVRQAMEKAGKSPRTIQYALAVVRQVFHFADANDLWSGPSPTRRIKHKLGDNRRHRFLFNRGITDRTHRVVFHTLRHTYASWLAMQGVPMLTIAHLMGHKTLAMTERYSHLSPEHLREAVNDLEVGIKAALETSKVLELGRH